MKNGSGIFGSDDWEEKEEPQKTLNEQYGEEMLKKPEYKRIGIGIQRLCRSLSLIESSWQNKNRSYSLSELESVLQTQHELEASAEKIEDVFFRGYLHDQIDSIAGIRRSLAEEIKWDIETKKAGDTYGVIAMRPPPASSPIAPESEVFVEQPPQIELPVNEPGERY